MNAPREDIIRAVLRAPELRADDEQQPTLHGYAAVFNADTEINSWEGHFIERIAPGAFRKTLAERGDKVKLLFNHGMDPQIGDKPLGKPSVLEEDRHGLRVEAPLDDTSYNRDLIPGLRSGALDGMSFRFSVAKEEWDETPEPSDENPRGLPVRTLKELRLFEVGPVTFPAYEATSVGIRSREAFTLWRSTPPAERKRLFEEYGLAIPGAVHEDTRDSAADEPPSGTRTTHEIVVPRLALWRDVAGL